MAEKLVDGLQPSRKGERGWWPIERLKPWAANPRKNAHAVPAVVKSLKKFGWGRPIIVNNYPGCEGEIIAGHTAWLAAQQLGLELVPVRVRKLPPKLAHGLALADNRTAEFSKWDNDGLAQLLTEEIGQDLFEAAGFATSDLAKLLGEPSHDPAVDEPPPLAYEVVVECDSEEQQTQVLEWTAAKALKAHAITR